MVILAARGVYFRYPGAGVALDGLDLEIKAGERLAILGPNGSGKTTLLLHLNGSLRPERGAVCLDGEPAGYGRAALSAWRRRVGLVLQDPDDQLFAGTVYQDVSFGPLNLGLAEAEVRQRVVRALDDLHIAPLADRPIHALSLGQKRRVVIAGTLAMTPEVLLLDEPTAGLDPHGVAHLLAALRRLAESGTTIVFATHDVDLALDWADRVALFAGGRMIACDEPARALADARLVRQAHLRRPMLLDLGEVARNAGLIGADQPLPKTLGEMQEILQRAGARSGPGAAAAPPSAVRAES
ncbi:MAG: ABC transporter ATP-binding protein [Rhodospirillales bacterium]|nr:ABC transporter ATP-binding protein [Rhodospirillales bacterium]